MRTVIVFTVLVAFVLFAGSVLGEGPAKTKWFDMENCGFCKNLTEPPDMLDHCIWEHHKTDDGCIIVATLDEDYIEPYRAAIKKMEEVGKRMEAGEMVPMCGMCMAYGSLMMKGVKFTHVDTKVGSVETLTADTPELVAEIHAMVDKTNAEMAKMEAGHHEMGDEDHNH